MSGMEPGRPGVVQGGLCSFWRRGRYFIAVEAMRPGAAERLPAWSHAEMDRAAAGTARATAFSTYERRSRHAGSLAYESCRTTRPLRRRGALKAGGSEADHLGEESQPDAA